MPQAFMASACGRYPHFMAGTQVASTVCQNLEETDSSGQILQEVHPLLPGKGTGLYKKLLATTIMQFLMSQDLGVQKEADLHLSEEKKKQRI